MFYLTCICKFTGLFAFIVMTAIETLYQHYLDFPIVCTDTRTIQKDCLFFALKGENFNANTFAEAALQQGAAFAIIDEEQFAVNERCIIVPDVLGALQELAKYHRRQLQLPVIGLTGSNGKTTTKELINAVLSEKYRVFATKGNLNNHIGVPLSVLSIRKDTEIAVIEMGANHQKEIEMLCEIAQPTHGLITNVGMAHLDGFGGFEGVKKGKAELYAYLKKTHGFAFIHRENPYLREMSQVAGLNKVIYYGLTAGDQTRGILTEANPFIALKWEYQGKAWDVHTHLTGTYNTENILAAVCIGNFFKVAPEAINRGLKNYRPVNNRSQLTETAKNKVICDFYNANPSSMAVALANLNALSAESKVVIIGDMFELGAESAEQHRQIVKLALAYAFDKVVFIGEHFFASKSDERGLFFRNRDEAKEYLLQHAVERSLVLLKGSRGMALEQLLPLL